MLKQVQHDIFSGFLLFTNSSRLPVKILKHPLDKILDDIPGRSAESIPRN